MARLSLSLLGTFQACLAGEPITAFESVKVRALLAYLAVESERPQRRETLAGLLWPEQPERAARHNLSQALFNLRRALGDHEVTSRGGAEEPFLRVERDAIRFNTSSDYCLDVTMFTSLLADCAGHHVRRSDVCDACVERLTLAVELYGGSFLAGFSLTHSVAFEEWLLLQRDRLHRLAMDALSQLAGCHARRGQYEPALEFAWRVVELDPWREEAQRQLMRLLTLSGRRSEALAQYETCRRVLAEELGVAPAAQTTELCQQIRDGEAALAEPFIATRAARPFHAAAFVGEDASALAKPPFVGREQELAQLHRFLDPALVGQGRVIFITGEAGAGKSALMHEFVLRAQERYPDLVVAGGSCHAYTGIGDPYHPFREVLGLLAGDVESRWPVGALDQESARRLWQLFPFTVQAIVKDGPDLINTFVPGPAMLERARAAVTAPGAMPDEWARQCSRADWLTSLKELVTRKAARNDAVQAQQSGLFDQYCRVLLALARQRPLLLTLDDLQWADIGSISLLFHLGRQVAHYRVLVVGAYRPEELDSATGQERHPLQPVVHELQRTFGDARVCLDLAEGREFVEALVDSYPNRLGPGFRETLWRQTRGHALFTVELLRDMQERGDLVRDATDCWVEGTVVRWEALPARVEAVIAARVGRLEKPQRKVLAVASVEGQRFTAQVIAAVLDMSARDVIRVLSEELGERHRLTRRVRDVSGAQGETLLAHYSFTHALFQVFLYRSMDESKRRLLHGEVAAAMEAHYGSRCAEIVVDLARHYIEAGKLGKAVGFLLQAGDAARALYAHEEAIAHYQRALELLKQQGDYERAARTLMKLGLTHHTAFDFPASRAAYDQGFTLWQRVSRVQPTQLPAAERALKMCTWAPATLDPTLARDTGSLRLTEQLFCGLAELTPEMDVVPDIARMWDVSDGGRKYVFHLRNDVFWSDGTAVTALDFEYAWKRILNPVTGSPNASRLYDICGARAYHLGENTDPESVGVRALEPFTLFVELDEPTAYFPYVIASSATYSVPRHVVETRGKAWAEVDRIVTNGPFRIESWRQGDCLILGRNPRYHGQFTGNVHHVELAVVPAVKWSTNMEIELYDADRLDVACVEWDTDHARTEHAAEYVTGPRLATVYVGFDTGRPPFDDVRVRRAFVLATDRETLGHLVLKGYQFPATGGFVPPGMPAHMSDTALPYDPDQAQRLLAQAGYSGGKGFPAVEALHPRGNVPHNEFLQDGWQKNLGIEIEWQQATWGALLERLNTAPPHLFRDVWWTEYPDPDSFLRGRLVRRWTGWQHPTYEKLVQQARHILDREERMTVYRRAQRILVEEAPIVPLAYLRFNLLVKPWVRRYVTSPIDRRYYKDVIIEPH